MSLRDNMPVARSDVQGVQACPGCRTDHISRFPLVCPCQVLIGWQCHKYDFAYVLTEV